MATTAADAARAGVALAEDGLEMVRAAASGVSAADSVEPTKTAAKAEASVAVETAKAPETVGEDGEMKNPEVNVPRGLADPQVRAAPKNRAEVPALAQI
jgi:hypothetical protein